MTTSASPISATPAVSTTPPVPQPKGQRYRIITPTTPYIDSNKPAINLHGVKTSMTVNTAIVPD